MENDTPGTLQVDKGHKIPAPRSKNAKYPFDTMEVGDSFLIECDEGDDGSENKEGKTMRRSRAYGATTWANGRYKPKKFTARSMRDEGGVRIWRTE
jgi:hypothetical protein